MKGESVMKSLKFLLLVTILLYSVGCVSIPEKKEETPFKDYNAIVVKNFTVTPTAVYADSAGPLLADRIVFWLRYYNSKVNFFDGVVLEGTHEVKQEKILLITGEFKGYSILYQFIDGPTGNVVKEGEIPWGRRNLKRMDVLLERSARHIARIVFAIEKQMEKKVEKENAEEKTDSEN
jgi:hypothetical protein